MEDRWAVRPRTVAWAGVGAAITAVVAYALYASIGALVVGLFLYYGTRPVDRWLRGRTGHPDVNAAIALFVVGLPLLAVLVWAGLVGVREANQLLATTNLNQYQRLLRPYVEVAALIDPENLFAGGGAGRFVSALVSVAERLFVWTVRLFIAAAVAFYLLRDDDRIAAWFRESFQDYPDVVEFVERVDDDLTTIYTGNLVTIGVTSLIAVGVYYGLDVVAPVGTGVAFPVLLGLLTGIATLVPAVGMKLVWVPYAAYLVWDAFQGEATPLWFPVAFAVVTFVVVDTIPDIFIRSYLAKGGLRLGLMLFAYVLGAVAFGWYGVFLGPLILVLFLHFARRLLPNLLDEDASAYLSD